MLSHWSPQRIRKAAQKHNKGSNRIHFQFRKAFGYESYQAIRSNPGAFPCTDLSLVLLVLSPAPFQHCWEQQHHRYQWHHTATGKWRWWIQAEHSVCASGCVSQGSFQQTTLLQSVPAPHTGETLEQLVLYPHEQTAPQGSKTLRRDRHRQLGLQLLPVQCTSENQHMDLSVSVSSRVTPEWEQQKHNQLVQRLRSPSTLQNNLYENIRIPVTLKWQNINPIRVSSDPMLYNLFYKWQLEQKNQSNLTVHTYLRESLCSMNLHRWLNHYPHFIYSTFL